MEENTRTATFLAWISPKATYAGSTTVVVSSVNLNDLGIVIGVVIAAAGYFTNLYFKRKEDKRAQERHDAITAGWTQ